MSKTYLVSEERLRDMMSAELELAALKSGGVDNWTWYGESYNNYLEYWKRILAIPADTYPDFYDISKITIDREFTCITNNNETVA